MRYKSVFFQIRLLEFIISSQIKHLHPTITEEDLLETMATYEQTSGECFLDNQKNELLGGKNESLNPKCISSKELLNLFAKNQLNKERLLKQLEQLDIDTEKLEGLTLAEIYREVEPIMKNTYSIKYLGLNNNEMGIVSRRIDPTKETESILYEPPNLTYTINKYFYPKPLKVGKKPPKQHPVDVNNLESEIKKSFQTSGKSRAVGANNKQNCIKAVKEAERMRRTEVAGSWLSIGKIQNTIANPRSTHFKKADTTKINIASTIKEPKKAVNSYSNFLKQGIILVKDC